MYRIQHPRVVGVAFPAWLIFLFWLWPQYAHAATLGADLRGYDWDSLFWAGVVGAAGGFGAFILSLAGDRRVMLEVALEGVRNMVAAPLAGAAAFLMLNAASAQGWVSLDRDTRFVALLIAGYAGLSFFDFAKDRITKLYDAATSFASKGKA